jgi:hypothetical protein
VVFPRQVDIAGKGRKNDTMNVDHRQFVGIERLFG